MGMTERVDVESVSGDTLILNTSVEDSSGNALDLSGASLKYEVERTSDHTAVVELSVGSGITVTDASAGECEIKIPAADSETLAGYYRHELEVTRDNGDVGTVFQGGVVFVRDAVA